MGFPSLTDLFPEGSVQAPKTARTPQHDILPKRYRPLSVSELCTPFESIDEVRKMIVNERFFAISSTPGIGATAVAELLCRENDIVIHYLSCAQGCAEIVKVLKNNMHDVLLAIQSQTKRVMYFLKDIHHLHKGDKSTILKIIEETPTINCILFITSDITTSWKRVDLLEPTNEARLVHLAWIANEEGLFNDETFDMTDLEELARFSDLRYAITCLGLRASSSAEDRDTRCIEDFSKILYAHELLTPKVNDHATMTTLTSFTELLALLDVSEFRSTREWYTDILSMFVDQNLLIGTKQTHVARHAQICHRIMQLKRSCKTLGIDVCDMDLYSKLFRSSLLEGKEPLYSSAHTAESEDQARSLYMIAKMRAPASQCKLMKKRLRI